jgi:hypothetical protein
MSQESSPLLPLRQSDLPLNQSEVDLKQSKLAVEPVVSSVSIMDQFSDIAPVDDLIKKIFNQYSKVKSEFEKLSDSSTPNPDSAWATFDTTVLEPAKSAFDNDKQEIIKKKNKKPSAPQAGDVTVTPPAKDETPQSKENANDKYTKFYEKLTSKTDGDFSKTLKLPLEFSEYPRYVETNFKEFNTVAGNINTAIITLNDNADLNGITIETFNKMETGSLNLFFALLFFRCMKGKGDKNMNGGKLERALTNLSLDKINDIIQALREKNAGYSFEDIIDKLNEQLFDSKSRLVNEIDPSMHDVPEVRAEASLAGGSSSKSKKSRKSHKSYHPGIGKTKKHHHGHHKKVSFVH